MGIHIEKTKKNIFYWCQPKKKENVPRYNQGMTDWSHWQQASGWCCLTVGNFFFKF